MRVSRPNIAPPLVAETPGEMNHRPGAMLSAGSQTVLPTVRFSPATTVSFTAAANNHSHVDLRCRRCPASRPRKPGSWNPDERTDRNDVPLRHRGGVSGCGWCGRLADDAES